LSKKNFLWIGKIFAVALIGMAWVAKADSVYIKPTDVNWEKVLGGPPAADSDEQKQEIAHLLEWQAKRTPTDVARCKSEETAESLPLTATLLRGVQGDIKTITTLAKAKWERKRPPYVDDRIKPCVKVEENGSYPSAHAVRGVVWSRILAEMFPEKKDDLLKRGLLMGEDRVISGIHFPSDVTAGQKLGDAIADKLLANPDFQAALKQAKDECEKAGIAGTAAK
jgi:acid phosphatase (class A)